MLITSSSFGVWSQTLFCGLWCFVFNREGRVTAELGSNNWNSVVWRISSYASCY